MIGESARRCGVTGYHSQKMPSPSTNSTRWDQNQPNPENSLQGSQKPVLRLTSILLLTSTLAPQNLNLPPQEMSPTLAWPWRQTVQSDIPQLFKLSEQIHPDLPESEQVFHNRLTLFPRGCLTLTLTLTNPTTTDINNNNTNQESQEHIKGYIISHPIPKNQPPPQLDTLLETNIPPDTDASYHYYIHDIAISPDLRGKGLAREGIEMLLFGIVREKGYQKTALVSVYGTALFWEGFGFEVVDDENITGKLACYGEGAVFIVREERVRYLPELGSSDTGPGSEFLGFREHNRLSGIHGWLAGVDCCEQRCRVKDKECIPKGGEPRLCCVYCIDRVVSIISIIVFKPETVDQSAHPLFGVEERQLCTTYLPGTRAHNVLHSNHKTLWKHRLDSIEFNNYQ